MVERDVSALSCKMYFISMISYTIFSRSARRRSPRNMLSRAMKKVLISRPVLAVVVEAAVEEGAVEVALAGAADAAEAVAEGVVVLEEKLVPVNAHGRIRTRPAEEIITVNVGTTRRWLALVLWPDPRLRIASNGMQVQDI
jgi:hypothetical protein